MPHASIVMWPPEIGDSGDVTDFFMTLGRSTADFYPLLQAARRLPAEQRERLKQNAYPSGRLATDIDYFKARISIVAIIGHDVPLHRMGRTFVGRCCFHDDRVPSLVVYPDTQSFYCFGCGVGGDVFRFLMAREHLTFREAVAVLVQETGIAMDTNVKQPLKTVKHQATPTPSAVLTDGTLVEMIYDPAQARTRFAVCRNGVVSYEDDFLMQGQRLVPYSPHISLLVNEVVLFPSQVDEYESEEDLVHAIQRFIHRYVDVSPLFESIAAYYVLLSWIYDAFNELPYLRVRGDMGSGKTRFLLTVGSVCYKPIFASGASTVSPLFRLVHAFRGTLIIDEGDFRFSDEKAEVIKILNNGNARGFPVLRSEAVKGKELSPTAYQVYGPKLVATRGFFEDKALESRCLTEEMGTRHLHKEIPLNLTDAYKADAQTLRNQFLMFRFRNFADKPLDPSLADRALEPRLNQVFIPLLSIIADDQARTALHRIARDYQRQLVADRGFEVEAQVLEILRELTEMPQGEGGISLKTITSYFVERHQEEYERKITSRWVGGLLKKLGLKTEKVLRNYVIPPSELSKLARLYEKYGIEAPVERP
jgi:CHC2 zinc finger